MYNKPVIRTYTMRLKVTKRQDETLHRLLAQLCELYNMALQQRRNAYRELRFSVNYLNQQTQLTELRGGIEEYGNFPVAIQRDPLRRLDRAFKAFFRRCKSGEKPGFPRFRSRDRYDSFNVPSGSFSFSDGMLKLTRLGTFRTKTKCKIKGDPLEIRIKRCGQKWQAQVVCDIGPALEKIAVRNAVGIDVGLTALATLSDGTEIANPRWTKQEEDRLADANRDLARKKNGSNNRKKSKEHLRRVHQRIAGLRSSYLTSVAKQLVSEYDLIAHEKLNIKDMVQSRFAKSIMDAAWNQLIFKLNSEAECAGKWVIPVNPRNTTKTCSRCGELVPKALWQRQHDCPHCGLSLGRDHNAALNILRLGESLVSKQNCMLSSI
jgi:putative transposase